MTVGGLFDRDPRRAVIVPGLRVGAYVVLRKLGEGTMGEVWECSHFHLPLAVAIKFFKAQRSSSRSARRRFLAEAQTIASIRHANVVTVLDCGETEDGTPYFVMELLKGCSLRQLLSKHPVLGEAKAYSLLTDACRGIEAAHRAGIVHRDLKPENLFVVEDDDGASRLKVLDFGVAKRLGERSSTQEGVLVGTVCYMAPEQALGVTTDKRADIYALGAILYEVLSGTPFNAGRTSHAQLLRALDANTGRTPPLLGLPPAAASVVRRATARSPEKRFASVSELSAAIAALSSSDRDFQTHLDTLGHHAAKRFPRRSSLRAPGGGRLHRLLFVSLAIALASSAIAASFRGSEASQEGSSLLAQPPPDSSRVSGPVATTEPQFKQLVPMASTLGSVEVVSSVAPTKVRRAKSNVAPVIGSGLPASSTLAPLSQTATGDFLHHADGQERTSTARAGHFIIQNPYVGTSSGTTRTLD